MARESWMNDNPFKEPPMVSMIAMTLLHEREKRRMLDRRILRENEHRIAAWAERVVLAGPGNHHEECMHKEAFSEARAVYRMMVGEMLKAIGK